MRTTEEQVMQIINFIKKIETERNREPEKIYTRGNCGNLFTLLKQAFPEAEALFVELYKHIITNINGRSYDINGPVSFPHTVWDYYVLAATEDDINRCSNGYGRIGFGRFTLKSKKEKKRMEDTMAKLTKYISEIKKHENKSACLTSI